MIKKTALFIMGFLFLFGAHAQIRIPAEKLPKSASFDDLIIKNATITNLYGGSLQSGQVDGGIPATSSLRARSVFLSDDISVVNPFEAFSFARGGNEPESLSVIFNMCHAIARFSFDEFASGSFFYLRPKVSSLSRTSGSTIIQAWAITNDSFNSSDFDWYNIDTSGSSGIPWTSDEYAHADNLYHTEDGRFLCEWEILEDVISDAFLMPKKISLNIPDDLIGGDLYVLFLEYTEVSLPAGYIQLDPLRTEMIGSDREYLFYSDGYLENSGVMRSKGGFVAEATSYLTDVVVSGNLKMDVPELDYFELENVNVRDTLTGDVLRATSSIVSDMDIMSLRIAASTGEVGFMDVSSASINSLVFLDASGVYLNVDNITSEVSSATNVFSETILSNTSESIYGVFEEVSSSTSVFDFVYSGDVSATTGSFESISSDRINSSTVDSSYLSSGNVFISGLIDSVSGVFDELVSGSINAATIVSSFSSMDRIDSDIIESNSILANVVDVTGELSVSGVASVSGDLDVSGYGQFDRIIADSFNIHSATMDSLYIDSILSREISSATIDSTTFSGDNVFAENAFVENAVLESATAQSFFSNNSSIQSASIGKSLFHQEAMFHDDITIRKPKYYSQISVSPQGISRVSSQEPGVNSDGGIINRSPLLAKHTFVRFVIPDSVPDDAVIVGASLQVNVDFNDDLVENHVSLIEAYRVWKNGFDWDKFDWDTYDREYSWSSFACVGGVDGLNRLHFGICGDNVDSVTSGFICEATGSGVLPFLSVDLALDPLEEQDGYVQLKREEDREWVFVFRDLNLLSSASSYAAKIQDESTALSFTYYTTENENFIDIVDGNIYNTKNIYADTIFANNFVFAASSVLGSATKPFSGYGSFLEGIGFNQSVINLFNNGDIEDINVSGEISSSTITSDYLFVDSIDIGSSVIAEYIKSNIIESPVFISDETMEFNKNISVKDSVLVRMEDGVEGVEENNSLEDIPYVFRSVANASSFVCFSDALVVGSSVEWGVVEDVTPQFSFEEGVSFSEDVFEFSESDSMYMSVSDATSLFSGFRVGKVTEEVQSVVKIDLSSIPENAIISGASISLGGLLSGTESFQIEARLINDASFVWDDFNWNFLDVSGGVEWATSVPAHVSPENTVSFVEGGGWDTVGSLGEGRVVSASLERSVYYVVFYASGVISDSSQYLHSPVINVTLDYVVPFHSKTLLGFSIQMPSNIAEVSNLSASFTLAMADSGDGNSFNGNISRISSDAWNRSASGFEILTGSDYVGDVSVGFLCEEGESATFEIPLPSVVYGNQILYYVIQQKCNSVLDSTGGFVVSLDGSGYVLSYDRSVWGARTEVSGGSLTTGNLFVENAVVSPVINSSSFVSSSTFEFANSILANGVLTSNEVRSGGIISGGELIIDGSGSVSGELSSDSIRSSSFVSDGTITIGNNTVVSGSLWANEIHADNIVGGGSSGAVTTLESPLALEIIDATGHLYGEELTVRGDANILGNLSVSREVESIPFSWVGNFRDIYYSTEYLSCDFDGRHDGNWKFSFPLFPEPSHFLGRFDDFGHGFIFEVELPDGISSSSLNKITCFLKYSGEISSGSLSANVSIAEFPSGGSGWDGMVNGATSSFVYSGSDVVDFVFFEGEEFVSVDLPLPEGSFVDGQKIYYLFQQNCETPWQESIPSVECGVGGSYYVVYSGKTEATDSYVRTGTIYADYIEASGSNLFDSGIRYTTDSIYIPGNIEVQGDIYVHGYISSSSQITGASTYLDLSGGGGGVESPLSLEDIEATNSLVANYDQVETIYSWQFVIPSASPQVFVHGGIDGLPIENLIYDVSGTYFVVPSKLKNGSTIKTVTVYAYAGGVSGGTPGFQISGYLINDGSVPYASSLKFRQSGSIAGSLSNEAISGTIYSNISNTLENFATMVSFSPSLEIGLGGSFLIEFDVTNYMAGSEMVFYRVDVGYDKVTY